MRYSGSYIDSANSEGPPVFGNNFLKLGGGDTVPFLCLAFHVPATRAGHSRRMWSNRAKAPQIQLPSLLLGDVGTHSGNRERKVCTVKVSANSSCSNQT